LPVDDRAGETLAQVPQRRYGRAPPLDLAIVGLEQILNARLAPIVFAYLAGCLGMYLAI
jgi:hypothetical protein